MNNSGMDPAVSDPNVREQRLLAAIVFTDVVGFSKLAAKNEARVYVALQRDMGVMTDLCRAHGGHVLNTMGDGMLMSFPSAVDAMACAVEIQRTLAAQSQSLPPSEVLHHRIGVHLGDVIVKGDNVFGDGVNTAARLQTEARPDSIWFSHTVHEVIKNKLKFDSRYVGKRQFKNLGEPLQVWEVPPVAEVVAQLQADAAGLGAPNVEPEPDGVIGAKALILIVASIVMVIAVVFMVTRMTPANKKADVKNTPSSRSVQAAINRLKNKKPSSGTTTATTTDTPTPTQIQVTADEARAKVDQLKRVYDFAGIVAYVQGDGKVHPDAQKLVERFSKLAQFRQWLDYQLQRSTAADMINATLSSGQAQIYSTPSGLQIQYGSNGFQPLDVTTLTPADFSALANAVESWPTAQKPPDISDWNSTFAEEYQH